MIHQPICPPRILQKSQLSVKVTLSLKFINITADELVQYTSAVAACYNVGIRPQTSFIAAICNKSGVNLGDVALSRNTVHRKRYNKVEELGDQIR